MKNLLYLTATSFFLLGACQSNTAKDSSKLEEVSKETLAVHDEIMPQISLFDRTTVKIDSLLGTKIEEPTKNELIQLKANLEAATDNMMSWMKGYSPDSTDMAYQEAELVKVKAMKQQFEDVSLESNTKLAPFK